MNNIIKIGIVEDHEGYRNAIVNFLSEKKEFNVVFELPDGHNVLEAITKYAPDIILLDMHMPNVDGLTTIDEIRAHYPNQKIIVVSNSITPYTASYIPPLDVQAMLPKNINAGVLKEKIIEVFKMA